MTNERKIQLGTAVDPTGAQQGLQAIEQAGAKTAAALGQSATAAGKAIDGIGDGGDRAARKLQAAERGIVASIQRATAAAQAGERGTAAFYETLARQRGVDPNTLRPYLEQLRAAEQVSRAAAAGVGQIGVSAAQTAAALRGVPAQFTDIVTSLQGGQAPLTVLLQQGGQLRDMFGSAGAAARALGGFVVGLVSPFTLAAAAAAALAYAYKVGSDEASAYSRAIILSGQAAGVTAGQLQDMARGVAALGAGTQGRAAEILALLAASADVGAGNMARFTAAALEFERVGGGAAEETARAFQSLADKPLQAALKLNETTGFLTVSTYAQIKSLEEQGRTTDAARVAQEAYATAIETRTPELVAQLGYVELAWKNIKEATKGAVDAVARIGRGLGTEDAITALQKRIASVQAGNEGARGRDLLPALQAQVLALQQGAKYEALSAFYSAQRVASVKASAQFDAEANKYLDKRTQMQREIAQAEQVGLAAGKSRAEIEALIGKIREKYTEKAAAAPRLAAFKAEEQAARGYMQALEALTSIQQQAAATGDGLSKTQAKLRDVQADPAWASYSRQQQEQIISQAASAQAAEDQAAAIKAGAKVAAEASRDYAQWVEALGRGGSAVAAQVQAMQDEAQAAQIAATGRMSLREAIEEVTIARLREQQVAALGNPDAVAAIQREIDAREKLRGLVSEKEQREAAAGAAKEWARSAEKIGDSITDALMRGFESGKGFAESLRDTVVNMFKTMVLKPVISAIVSPISGAISGAVGGALGLSAGSAAAGGLSAGAGIAGAGLLGGSLGLFGSGFSSGLSAWGAGGSVTGLLGSGSSLFAGGVANGLGTLAGALGPIALGVGAIAALAKSLDKGGTPSYGSIYTIGTDGRNGGMLTPQAAAGYQLGTVYSAAGSTNQAVQDTVRQFTVSLASTVGAAFSTFGLRPGTVRAGFAADNDDPSIGRLTIRDASGRLLTDRTARYDANSTKGFEQFAADAGRALRDALVAADLPGWVDGLLQDLGAAPTVEAVQQMVQSVAQLRGVFQQFGGTLGLTEPEIVGLAKAFGGVGELANGLSGYLAAIYTDSERLTLAQQSLSSAFSQLGQSVPANAAAYRALVDAQDLSTDAGRATYAAMLRLAPAFAEVTSAAEAAATEQARLAEQVASQRGGLETQLLRLYGNTTELRRRELAALEPANRALQLRIYALEDAQTAADAATELGEAWRGVATTIEDEIERISGLNRTQTASLAQIQAEFITATAQARAGDKAAAERLPELSATLLDLAQKSATSALEVTAVRASVLDSLSQTAQIVRAAGAAAEEAANARLGSLLAAGGVGGADAGAEAALAGALGDLLALLTTDKATPSSPPAWSAFAAGGWHSGGLRMVGESGPELEATGPARIWSADQTARMLSGFDQAALLAELRALRAEVVDLRAEARATAGHTAAMSRLQKRWDGEGLTVRNDADTPLTTTVT